MRQFTRISRAALLGAIVSAPTAWATAPAGGEVLVHGSTTSSNGYPSVAINDSRRFVIAWESTDLDNIAAQRFGADGGKLGGPVLVSDQTGGSQQGAAVAMQNDGSFVVCWQASHSPNSPNTADIFARRFAANGSALTSGFRVTTGTAQYSNCKVAMDEDGDFVIAWQGDNRVLARRYSATAVAKDAAQVEVLAPTQASGQTIAFGDIGIADTGDYAISVAFAQTSPTYDIGVRIYRYQANGTSLGYINTSGTNTFDFNFYGITSLGVNGTGAMAVTTYVQDLVRLYNAAGVKQGGDITFDVPPLDNSGGFPDLEVRADGGFVIAFDSQNRDGGTLGFMDPGMGIFAREFDSAGVAVNSTFKVNTTVNGRQSDPAVAMNDAGDFVIAWGSLSEDGGYGGSIRAQCFGAFPSCGGTAPTPDTTPNAFTFVDKTGMPVSVLRKSNIITVGGINAPAAISVTGGKYSIGCTATFTNVAATISNGQTVCVQHTTAALPSTKRNTLLTIGGVSDTFTTTTAAATTDTTPNAFTFVDKTGMPLSVVRKSNIITVGGINAPAAISVSGGQYSIGCTTTFTNVAATISNGQTVCVKHTTSALPATKKNTVLTIGGVSDTFSTTTAP